MRLGAPLFASFTTAEEWVKAHHMRGYSAAFCPDLQDSQVEEFRSAAEKGDLVIAEVGAWCNPLSTVDEERRKNIAYIQERLALADRIGANCCVNIAGSLGAKWDGPDPRDLTEDTFALIVDSVREIIDAVKPTRTAYSLEPMPWMYPDSTESYERLIKVIDRPGFGVHFDPVNLINCPERSFQNGAYIRAFVERLGGHIRSVHAKDSRMGTHLTLHLEECRPGLGNLDYATLLTTLEAVNPQLPLLVEHLPDAGEYDQAVVYIREQAQACGVKLI